jgi:hypothetical protein
MERAKDRAQAMRNYRHYRKVLASKRLTDEHRESIAQRADALAARYNLTNVRYSA